MCFKNLFKKKSVVEPLKPDDDGVKVEFDRIAAIPYDEKNYNCLNKSMDFQKYLLEHGATDCYIKRIKHQSDEYMHAFVLWNLHAFDPTSEPPFYDADYGNYLLVLEGMGFDTGMVY